MEQKEKIESKLNDVQERNELKKMNDAVFKTMFEEVITSHINPVKDEIEYELENIEEKVKNVNKDNKVIKESLIKLNSSTVEKFNESESNLNNHLDSIKSSNQIEIANLIKLIEDNKKEQISTIENFKKENFSIYNVRSQEIVEKLTSLIEKNRDNQSNILNNLNSEFEEKSIEILKVFSDNEKVQLTELEKLDNNQSNTAQHIIQIKTEIETKLKKLENQLIESENLLVSHNKSIENLETGLFTGNERLEENLKLSNTEQLASYKDESINHINSLKKAMIWLMGFNILLALSILVIIIIVLL